MKTDQSPQTSEPTTTQTNTKTTNQDKAPIFIIIIILVIALATVITVIFLKAQNIPENPPNNSIPASNQPITNLDDDSGTDTPKTVDERLDELTRVLCNGNYSTVYQSQVDTGIFHCANGEIYSVTAPATEEKTGHYTKGYASFIGTTKLLASPNALSDFYFIHNYNTQQNNLYLLIEADSEQAAVDKVAAPLYAYLVEHAKYYNNDNTLGIHIFYNEQLDTVKSLSDYVIIAGAIGFVTQLPHGYSYQDSYTFAYDDTSALSEIGANPSTYSSQTRNAIKFHTHTNYGIANNQPPATIEELKTGLMSSFVME